MDSPAESSHECMCDGSMSLPCVYVLFVPVGQVREYWLGYELEMVNYQNKCRLIKGWDDLFNKCKEHINQVVAMKLSPYFKVGVCWHKALCFALCADCVVAALSCTTRTYCMHVVTFLRTYAHACSMAIAIWGKRPETVCTYMGMN